MPKLNAPELKAETYKAPKAEEKIVSAVWAQWEKARDQRIQSYRFFNDRSFVDYVNDSIDRFNGYIEPRTDAAADWGAHVFNNVTRQKTVSIIANITQERVKAEFFPQNQNDENEFRAAQLIKHFEDYTYYKNHDDEQQFFSVLEATTKGTTIGYEGYKVDKRKIKEITKYDPESGEVEFKETEKTDWDDVYGEVIPLFDFYPGNIWVREMQRQPFVIWRTVLDFDVFQAEFEKYKNVKKVIQKSEMLTEVSDDRSKDAQSTAGQTTSFVSGDVQGNQVEVIRYFNRWTDEFHIIANSVLLTKTVSPFPWDHKSYPFWKTIFEPFSANFFYGKSLPDKLRSNQDVLNDLYRMVLDQSFLSINPPILTQGLENIKDEYLFPGRRVPVEDIDQTKVMEIPGPQPAHFSIIEMVESNLKKDSIDDPLSGVSGSRVSAFEVGVAKEGAQRLLSMFLRTLEWGVRDKTELRVKNILQFYRLPKLVEIAGEEVLEYRKIVMDNVPLVDGTQGRQVTQMMGADQQMPDKEAITKAELWYMAKGQNMAFSFLSTDLMENLDLKIKIIPNSSLKMSEALRRALELDYQQKAALLYPDLMNREEGWREFNEAFDKDPQKMTNPAASQGPAAPGSPLGSVEPAPMGTNPAQGYPPASIPGMARSGPSMSSPNSSAAAGVPTTNSTSNSMRNIAV